MMVNKDGELEGFSVDLIAKIAELLSFRYEIYLSPDGLYGGWNENTGYTGIVGQITQNVSAEYCLKLVEFYEETVAECQSHTIKTLQ